MNKNTIIIIISAVVVIGAIWLFNAKKNNNTENDVKQESSNTDNTVNGENEDMSIVSEIKVIIEGEEYKATLENNKTASALVDMLPLQINMTELNGNEKYRYMGKPFPVHLYQPEHIEAGDIMLYSADCLVVFYKSFETNGIYTKIGHIDNLPDLGNGNVIVRFEKY